MQYTQYLLLLLLLKLAESLPWDGPQATPTAGAFAGVELFKNDLDALLPQSHNAWSPAPLREPRAFFDMFELWKRQTLSTSGSAVTSAAFSSSTASGPTCGFGMGSTGDPYTCSAGRTCAIATAQNIYGCCRNTAACSFSTSCIPQTRLASCAGNSQCQGDSYLTKCDTTYPYCGSFVLSGQGNSPATYFFCDSTPTAATIFATATDGAKSSASYAFISMSVPTPSSSDSSSPSTTFAPTSTSIPTSIGSSSVSTVVVPASTASSSGGKATPIGPIVGGVIGGIAIIAALIIGVVVLLKKKKKVTPSPNSGSAPAPVVYANQSSPPVVNQAVGYYGSQVPVDEKQVYTQAQPTTSPYSPQSSTSQQYQQPQSMYSPPQSPTPQYTPAPPQTTYPGHLSEVDGTPINSRAGSRYY